MVEILTFYGISISVLLLILCALATIVERVQDTLDGYRAFLRGWERQAEDTQHFGYVLGQLLFRRGRAAFKRGLLSHECWTRAEKLGWNLEAEHERDRGVL